MLAEQIGDDDARQLTLRSCMTPPFQVSFGGRALEPRRSERSPPLRFMRTKNNLGLIFETEKLLWRYGAYRRPSVSSGSLKIGIIRVCQRHVTEQTVRRRLRAFVSGVERCPSENQSLELKNAFFFPYATVAWGNSDSLVRYAGHAGE